jgi:hypothetical protein
MKRFVLFLSLALLAGGFTAAQSLQGKTMYVAIRTAELKTSRGFFADTVGVLSYGDQVTVLRQDGRWVEVSKAGQPPLTGWIASTSLTTKRITAAGSGTSASADELALAGKGFSEEVENSYRDSGAQGAANYAEIDAIEAITVSQEELLRFLTEGHLTTGGR